MERFREKTIKKLILNVKIDKIRPNMIKYKCINYLKKKDTSHRQYLLHSKLIF